MAFDFMKRSNQMANYNPLMDPNLSPEERSKYVYEKPPTASEEQLADVLNQAKNIISQNQEIYKGPINPVVSTVTINDDGTLTESTPLQLTDEVRYRMNNGESPAQIAQTITSTEADMDKDPYNGFFIAQANQNQRISQQPYNPFAYQPSPVLNTGMNYNNYGYNPYYNPYYANSLYSYNGLPRMIYSKEDIEEMRKEREEAEREQREYQEFQYKFRGDMLYHARKYLGIPTTKEECYKIANNIPTDYVDDPNKVEIIHEKRVNIYRGDELIASFGGTDKKLVGDEINRYHEKERYEEAIVSNLKSTTINNSGMYAEWERIKQRCPQDATLEELDNKYFPEIFKEIDNEKQKEFMAKALLKASGEYTAYEKFVRKFTRKFRPNDYMYGYTSIGSANGYQPPLTLSDIDVNPNVVNHYRSEADLRRAKFLAQIMNSGNSPYHAKNYYHQ